MWAWERFRVRIPRPFPNSLRLELLTHRRSPAMLSGCTTDSRSDSPTRNLPGRVVGAREHQSEANPLCRSSVLHFQKAAVFVGDSCRNR